MLCSGPGDARALGLAIDPHRDPAGGEAHDQDPGASEARCGEMAEGIPGRLEALVIGELEEPGCHGPSPGAFQVHQPESALRPCVPWSAVSRCSVLPRRGRVEPRCLPGTPMPGCTAHVRPPGRRRAGTTALPQCSPAGLMCPPCASPRGCTGPGRFPGRRQAGAAAPPRSSPAGPRCPSRASPRGSTCDTAGWRAGDRAMLDAGSIHSGHHPHPTGGGVRIQAPGVRVQAPVCPGPRKLCDHRPAGSALDLYPRRTRFWM